MNENFVKATSQNLPKVDLVMLTRFIKTNDCFTDPELQNVKTGRSMRASYRDYAIGYVQLLRRGQTCTVQAKICPETKCRDSNYTVLVIIDERNYEIKKADCHCAASEGGCTHIIALIAWLYRKIEEPAPTSVDCYWKKPVLSMVGSHMKYVTMKSLLPPSLHDQDMNGGVNNNDFLKLVLRQSEAKKTSSHLLHYFSQNSIIKMSVHNLAISFKGNRTNVSEFLEFCSQVLTPKNCEFASKITKGQSEDISWFELKYGKMSASIIWECAHCST
ncbi:hypothetical protein QAD02_002108 [Eretmocerus hayati]|uniref:Uncharacterized protein n=1 Tax=Eretmocerus hayati TaxID=131215 RepID=A0ACC2NKL1_9HYME|nr:hypothetical protein QAD02_002108 [Eretmocerus hayati]